MMVVMMMVIIGGYHIDGDDDNEGDSKKDGTVLGRLALTNDSNEGDEHL